MYKYDPERINYFAYADSRGRKIPFGIKAKDRLRHMYIIGKTGMGKSTLLENLAIQDIQSGEGLCFIDPHGSTAEKLLDYIPKERVKDVVYFDPYDTDYPLGFNIMEDVGYDKRHLVVAGLMSSFKRIWVDAWSSRMEYILQNTLLALLEYPDSTLVDVNRMFVDKAFRKEVVANVKDPLVKAYWEEEFTKYTDKYTQEATPAIQNKIGQFTSNPLVRNIISQPKSTFSIKEIMDTRKIFIVNLSKGKIGEQNADVLGSILTTKIYLEAMGRAEKSAQELQNLPPFYLYVDEFQSVVNDSFANILSEARKYKLALTIAHQYLEQVEENIRAAVFGNAGTIISFRVGPFDAQVLKTIFEPEFTEHDLVNLGFAQIYLTLMVDGVATRPFSARTLPPIDPPEHSYKEEIIEYSRKTYGRRRDLIESSVRKRLNKDDEQNKKQKNTKAQQASTSANANQKTTEHTNSTSASKNNSAKTDNPKENETQKLAEKTSSQTKKEQTTKTKAKNSVNTQVLSQKSKKDTGDSAAVKQNKPDNSSKNSSKKQTQQDKESLKEKLKEISKKPAPKKQEKDIDKTSLKEFLKSIEVKVSSKTKSKPEQKHSVQKNNSKKDDSDLREYLHSIMGNNKSKLEKTSDDNTSKNNKDVKAEKTEDESDSAEQIKPGKSSQEIDTEILKQILQED